MSKVPKSGGVTYQFNVCVFLLGAIYFQLVCQVIFLAVCGDDASILDPCFLIATITHICTVCIYICIYVCMDGWMDRLISIYVIYIYTQCEAPKISKLVYNSNNYGLWYL